MRSLVFVPVIAVACGGGSEPKTGAFDVDSVVKQSDDSIEVHVHQRDVPLAEMSMGRWLGGLPMTGMANVDIDLSIPVEEGNARASRARGAIDASCTNCMLGDGKTKLDIGMDLPIQFGQLALGDITIRGTVGDGKAKITTWKFASTEMVVDIALTIDLEDDFATSPIDGCIRFVATTALEQRDPQMAALVALTGANKDADGKFSIKISGTAGAVKRLAMSCGTAIQ